MWKIRHISCSCLNLVGYKQLFNDLQKLKTYIASFSEDNMSTPKPSNIFY